MSKQNITDREAWYDRNAPLPNDRDGKTVKVSKQAKGALSEGFTKQNTPADNSKAHLQTSSTRDRVSTRWQPGAGKQHKGKASPSSEESFLKANKNKIQKGK